MVRKGGLPPLLSLRFKTLDLLSRALRLKASVRVLDWFWVELNGPWRRQARLPDAEVHSLESCNYR